MRIGLFIILTFCIVLSLPAGDFYFDCGSDGSDGDLVTTTSIYIDMDDGEHEDGVYHYKSVNVVSGTTVRFHPNKENTPVTWLVQGDVLINGDVHLYGERGRHWDSSDVLSHQATPGPGGFKGGLGADAYNVTNQLCGMAGEGPGGGNTRSNDDYYGGYGGAYGPSNVVILPLRGGSGGGGGQANSINKKQYRAAGGGAGGGAILIAANGAIEINGAIRARGGDGGNGYGLNWRDVENCTGCGGGGSGGAIRLMAYEIKGNGEITATGGSGAWADPGDIREGGDGGSGRIRIEAAVRNFNGTATPNPSISSFPSLINLPASLTPSVRIVKVNNASVPENPVGELNAPDVDFSEAGSVEVIVEVEGVPAGTNLTLRAAREQMLLAENTVGISVDTTQSPAQIPVNISLPPGRGVLLAWVTYTPTVPGGQSLMVNGEHVKSITVDSKRGVVYTLESGTLVPENEITDIYYQDKNME